MRITGIGGELAYLGESNFRLKNDEKNEIVEKKINRVGMIAAGSGISPMFQLIQTVADSGSSDTTSLSLIYSSRTPVRILMFTFRFA